MTDFFALFTQPRQPWLELDVLKEKHHELTRLTHPDLHGEEASKKFGETNEAYRILSDARLRIQYLLQIEGNLGAATNRPIPSDLQEMFLEIGKLCQTTRRVFAQVSNGNSALSRSLAKKDLLQLRTQTERLLAQLSRAYDACLAELRSLNELWNKNRDDAVSQLQRLHDRIAYSSRWIEQLKEMELQFKLRD